MQSYKYLASIYDECMYDVEYSEWYNYIKSLLDENNVQGEVLETACGTGNITQFLAKDYDVVAADISEEMLNIATEKLMQSGRKARFITADMSDFRRDKKFGAVVSAMDGVNYLTENASDFFACAYENLKPGGVLLFDISSAYKLSEVIGNEFFYDDGEDVTYLWTNEFAKPLLYMNITMFIKQQTKEYLRYDEQHVQRAYEKEEIISMLEKAGFNEIKVYGFLTKDAPASDAQRLQFIAKKG